ncbi:MAG TPA: RNB domain-containing ribonuclease [Pyrinomonadaceae bacterium]|nr:RNB domain-containing ribonuclease [Pyrinomonadaceae bacterium]
MNQYKQSHTPVDLLTIAQQSMHDAGFVIDRSPAIEREIDQLNKKPAPNISAGLRDLRSLLWSSIDDRKSRDLDQVEFAETLADGNTRLLIGIADVDAYVSQGSAIDQQAAENCSSVYTGVRTFPMLPEELSTGLTSLNAGADRLAIVTEMVLSSDGVLQSKNIYRALLQNRAKLSYESIGDWLDGKGNTPLEVSAVPGLEAQIRLQAESAKDLAQIRKEHGALEFGTIQATPVVDESGTVIELAVVEENSARNLIANFMIAANVAMAQFLTEKDGPTLRRIVRTPRDWSRIVEIAAEHGAKLPATPDSRALGEFLQQQKVADPLHFPDLSLAIVKSLGPGEYVVQVPSGPNEGHFGLAVQDYTHSTAPNRRFPDLVTQRLVKAALDDKPAPYSVDQLQKIADHCNERESAARKVERKMRKVAAAVLLKDKVGQEFKALVTGVSDKGTFARTLSPPVDGRVVRGEEGLRVGQKLDVRLLSTDPAHGFIDFAKA